jgi:hypothetical protein
MTRSVATGAMPLGSARMAVCRAARGRLDVRPEHR